jgi:uncharacterized protein YndB with AHSA1/START domain
MARHEIDVTVTTVGSAATVWALLRDGASWPSWSPLGSFELERPAADEPEGLGAVRIFRTRRGLATTATHEQIVELVPDRRFSYALLSGLPIRDYRADVDLTPIDDGGTSIRWHSTFSGGRVPGSGPLYQRILGKFVAEVAQGLAERAGQEARTGSSD